MAIDGKANLEHGLLWLYQESKRSAAQGPEVRRLLKADEARPKASDVAPEAREVLGGLGTRLDALKERRQRLIELARELDDDPTQLALSKIDPLRILDAYSAVRGSKSDNLELADDLYDNKMLAEKHRQALLDFGASICRVRALDDGIAELRKIEPPELVAELVAELEKVLAEEKAKQIDLSAAVRTLAEDVQGVLRNERSVKELFPGLEVEGRLSEVLRRVSDEIKAHGEANRFVRRKDRDLKLSMLTNGALSDGPLHKAAKEAEHGRHPFRALRHGYAQITAGFGGPFIEALGALERLETGLTGSRPELPGLLAQR
jgi:hypothetical protein